MRFEPLQDQPLQPGEWYVMLGKEPKTYVLGQHVGGQNNSPTSAQFNISAVYGSSYMVSVRRNWIVGRVVM